MSDMSFHWCRICANPEYACECDDPDFDPQTPVQKVMAGKPRAEIWEERHFFSAYSGISNDSAPMPPIEKPPAFDPATFRIRQIRK